MPAKKDEATKSPNHPSVRFGLWEGQAQRCAATGCAVWAEGYAHRGGETVSLCDEHRNQREASQHFES